MGYFYISSEDIEERLTHTCRDCGSTPGVECRTVDGQWLASLPAGCPVHEWRGVERPESPWKRRVPVVRDVEARADSLREAGYEMPGETR